MHRFLNVWNILIFFLHILMCRVKIRVKRESWFLIEDRKDGWRQGVGGRSSLSGLIQMDVGPWLAGGAWFSLSLLEMVDRGSQEALFTALYKVNNLLPSLG